MLTLVNSGQTATKTTKREITKYFMSLHERKNNLCSFHKRKFECYKQNQRLREKPGEHEIILNSKAKRMT